MQLFEVMLPGLFTTVQDLGRFRCRKFGLPAAGPMDSFSYRVGNILVGNREDDAALETTVLGPKLKVLGEAAIAITGGDIGFTINDEPAPMWTVLRVKAGDVLKSKGPRNGCRAYICVSGGIDVPSVMGSKSTHVLYHIGGIEGRALKKGDIIKIGNFNGNQNVLIGRGISEEIRTKISGILPEKKNLATRLRVIMGPSDDHFPSKSIKTFLNSDYVVTPLVNREAYRLDGPDIKHNSKGPDVMTSDLLPGTIQIPGGHKPIIFLHDRACGGYAIIAVVISVDLPRIGHLQPGDKIQFQKVTMNEAYALLEDFERSIASFKSSIQVTVHVVF